MRFLVINVVVTGRCYALRLTKENNIDKIRQHTLFKGEKILSN